MKRINNFVVGSLFVFLITLSAPNGKAWPWDNDDKQRRLDEEIQRRVQVEQQLTIQEAHTGHWRLATFTFATGAFFFLIIGTALGSKGRQHAERKR